jgi:beta-lactamase class A
MKYGTAGLILSLAAARSVCGDALYDHLPYFSAGLGSQEAEERVPVNYFTGEYLYLYQGEWYLTKAGKARTGLVHLEVSFGDHDPGFYYFLEDGRLETGPKVRKFKNVKVYGATFDGYYYHGENGRFYAKARGLCRLSGLKCNGRSYDGIYYIGDLGKLARRERPRYLKAQEVDGVSYPEGWYYFEEGGALCRKKMAHEIHGTFDGREFDGIYLFRGERASLDDSYQIVVAEGTELVEYAKPADMAALKEALEEKLRGYDGQWAVYVKNLDTDEAFSIGDKPMYSASLIKSFVMGAVFESIERGRLEEDAVLDRLLEQMITVSDNESYNELVRRLGKNGSFSQGADWVNAWLTINDYEATGCHHTLAPSGSASASDGTGERNVTSVEECGWLLESIYRGECVSKEASDKMLTLLLGQENKVKIPAGVPGDIQVANKTGETDTQAHDMAIVWGDSYTYILCVMSTDFKNEGTAVTHVGEISKQVYDALNPKTEEIKVWTKNSQ